MAHVDVLDRPECRRLLGTGGVGRVSVANGGAPVIRPVNFAVDGDLIVFRTGETALWRASQDGAPAVFEIDASDNRDHTAWSVIASGRLGELAVGERTDRLPLQPWMPGDRQRFVALGIDELSGRRIVPAEPGAPSAPPEQADPDCWGRSAAVRRVTSRFVDPLYRRWFRVTWQGLEHIPRDGGALLVANHAGAVPVDAMLLMHGIESELGRPVYGLHHHGLRELPFVGLLLERNGGVVAHPDNAVRLLRDERQLVLVFPEGTKGTTKHYRDRYRLARFGRGGFVESAMRAAVPVVPIAVTGTEEAMPSLVRVPIGVENGLPVPLNVMLFGPLGALLPYPAKVEARVLEPVVFDQPAGLDHYPASVVAAAAEDVRARLQAALASRVARRSGDR